jgi:hypothetical protein
MILRNRNRAVTRNSSLMRIGPASIGNRPDIECFFLKWMGIDLVGSGHFPGRGYCGLTVIA